MFGEAIAGNQRVRVKICGITNAGDARAAIDLGADALGFNFFAGSKRYINLASNAKWIANLPAEVCKVAVVVNPSLEEAIELAGLPFINALQLHGSESPDFCRILAERGISFAKAVPVGGNDSLVEAPDFFTDTILLDSASPRGFGGSGEQLPWATGRRFVENHPALRVVLAGGLNPENVVEAVKEVGPFAVDVASGVESSPGRKDRTRLRAFFASIRSS
jgi:phosphoribosylanthranilate isomerase